MKHNILNITFLAALIVCATSCSDYLDIPSSSKFDSESIFEDATKAEMAVVGCYPYTFNRELFYQLGMGTDACFSTESETNSKNQIANYVYTSSNAPTGTYNAMYQGIEYANVCIKKLSGMKSDDATTQKKYNHLLGEALAIRASNYLNLVRFFGDVPFITTPTSDAESFYSSRTSRDTIYDHIIADMQQATELLSWRSENLFTSDTERFTKNSAYGMLARIALYAAGYSLRWDLSTYSASSVKMAQRADQTRIKQLYQIAVDACKAVIDHGENNLLPKYETVFRDLMEKKFDNETMLQVGQYGAEVSSYNVGYTNGIYAHSNSIYTKAQPLMIANPVYYFDFGDGDTRRDVAICNYSYDSKSQRMINSLPSMTIGKFRVDWKTEVGTKVNARDIDFPILRYSDVLLMYAEALNEVNNGPTSDAINALKTVRLRAYGNDATKIGTIPSSHDEFLQAIQKERHLELAFEGIRRTDLCRWNILYKTLTQTKTDLLSLANGEGRFADFMAKHYAAYKVETATSFAVPTVAVEWIPITSDEQATYKAAGYTIQDMTSANSFVNSKQTISTSSAWMTTSLFRGLEENKVEILPLNTSSIIDVNKGLDGQQHPLY